MSIEQRGTIQNPEDIINKKFMEDYIKSGYGGKAKAISNVDLNTIIATGFYSCDVCTNRPTEHNGVMTVIQNNVNDNTFQVYGTFNANKLWYRQKYASSWTDWQELGGGTADSGAIGEFKQAPYLLPNFVVADGTTEYDKVVVHKRLFDVLTDNCPELLLEGSDEDHFKLLDLRGRYVKLGDTDVCSLGDETLPNIKGKTDKRAARLGYYIDNEQEGAFGKVSGNKECPGYGADHAACQFTFDASKGQVNEDGTTYVPQAQSVYKDGAKVNPDYVTMLPLIRYKVDRVEVNVRQEILDMARPIGSYFKQYGDTDNPNTLFNDAVKDIKSVWTEVAASADGEYEQVNSSVDAGTAVEETLPNITGNLGSGFTSSRAINTFDVKNGVFADSSSTSGAGVDSAGKNFRILNLNFNANNSNEVYQDGAKVHPKGFTVKVWKRIE